MSGRALEPRVVEELLRIHRRSRYFQGLTPAGELHLMAGGSIGGEDGMPMEQGMNSYSCCVTCSHRATPGGDEYPCETLALLIEVGAIPSVPEMVAP